jgi:hypothetical protein
MNKYPGGVLDDAFDTQQKSTSANDAGTVQNLVPVSLEQTAAGSTPEGTRSSEQELLSEAFPEAPTGAPTEVRITGDVDNLQPIKDDSISTQLENTRAQVAGTLKNLMDPNYLQGVGGKLMDPNYLQATAQSIGTYLNPSREQGGKMRNLPPNEDDSIQTQIMHTEAQVVDTFKDLSAQLVQAGEKIKGAFAGTTAGTTSEPPPKQQ